MCINHSKLSGEDRSSLAYRGEEREDRKMESPVSLILLIHQFKFKAAYSISVIQLSEFPRERIVFTSS
jgi:hypothetical protein